MALGPRLDLRQSQSLVMTPQLQQAIKLLALSNLELEAYLAEALEGNPLLDATSADGDGGASAVGSICWRIRRDASAASREASSPSGTRCSIAHTMSAVSSRTKATCSSGSPSRQMTDK